MRIPHGAMRVPVCKVLCTEAYSKHFRNVIISLLVTFLSLLGLSRDWVSWYLWWFKPFPRLYLLQLFFKNNSFWQQWPKLTHFHVLPIVPKSSILYVLIPLIHLAIYCLQSVFNAELLSLQNDPPVVMSPEFNVLHLSVASRQARSQQGHHTGGSSFVNAQLSLLIVASSP